MVGWISFLTSVTIKAAAGIFGTASSVLTRRRSEESDNTRTWFARQNGYLPIMRKHSRTPQFHHHLAPSDEGEEIMMCADPVWHCGREGMGCVHKSGWWIATLGGEGIDPRSAPCASLPLTPVSKAWALSSFAADRPVHFPFCHIVNTLGAMFYLVFASSWNWIHNEALERAHLKQTFNFS